MAILPLCFRPTHWFIGAFTWQRGLLYHQMSCPIRYCRCIRRSRHNTTVTIQRWHKFIEIFDSFVISNRSIEHYNLLATRIVMVSSTFESFLLVVLTWNGKWWKFVVPFHSSSLLAAPWRDCQDSSGITDMYLLVRRIYGKDTFGQFLALLFTIRLGLSTENLPWFLDHRKIFRDAHNFGSHWFLVKNMMSNCLWWVASRLLSYLWWALMNPCYYWLINEWYVLHPRLLCKRCFFLCWF